MTAKTKTLLKEVSQYIYEYHQEHSLPHDELSDWLMGEKFLNMWRKEYIDFGDEFLRMWLVNYYKRGKE